MYQNSNIDVVKTWYATFLPGKGKMAFSTHPLHLENIDLRPPAILCFLIYKIPQKGVIDWLLRENYRGAAVF